MKTNCLIVLGAVLLLWGIGCSQEQQEHPATEPLISGTLIDGYRVISIPAVSSSPLRIVVFRGDYIKFSLLEYDTDPTLSIPDLSLENRPVSRDLAVSEHFKMSTRGSFGFTIGRVSGTIEVLDFQQPNYSEMSALESAQLINKLQPVILDVRTPAEYASGHLANAVLIPVQQLQQRVNELSTHKFDTVLIYCATGNRSTVGSKILIDNGFKNVVNMRHGIKDWLEQKQPVVR